MSIFKRSMGKRWRKGEILLEQSRRLWCHIVCALGKPEKPACARELYSISGQAITVSGQKSK
jgi:hypothetical protein